MAQVNAFSLKPDMVPLVVGNRKPFHGACGGMSAMLYEATHLPFNFDVK
jgi:hypothetical protein